MFDPVKSFPIISSPALALFFLHPSLTPAEEKAERKNQNRTSSFVGWWEKERSIT
jgi:hypothetical protein